MIPLLSMVQFLCMDPIMADPLAFIETIEAGSLQNQLNYSESDKRDFQQALGVDCWQIWIQEGPRNEHFCIHYIECRSPSELTNAFKNQLVCENPYALWLQAVFQTYLPFEYSLTQPEIKVGEVLDLPIDPSYSSRGYDFCYLLPLLPGKLEDHKEYCRLAMNEKREATIAACKAFGMIHLKKWIQESTDKQYVLYYQKMREPAEEARQAFLALKDQPKALQATQTLREQTGVSFEELSPKVTCVTLFARNRKT